MLLHTQPAGPTTPADLLPPEFAAALDGLDVLSRRVLQGKLQGERRSKRRGRSVEFDDYRQYSSGDDLRHIDWNVFARMDRFFIKVFQEEEDLTVHVVLDASASMLAGTPAKLITAARLAAAIAYIALVNNSRLTFSAIGVPAGEGVGAHGLMRLEPLRGRRSAQPVVQSIAETVSRASASPPGGGGSDASDFASALRTLAAARTGKGVVVLLSDLLIPRPPGFEEGLRFFAASAGYDALAIQVLSPGELDPAREMAAGSGRPVLGGDVRLLDAETGRGTEVTINTDVLKRYRAGVARYIQSVESFCTARGIRHAVLTSDADVPGFVLSILRRRGLLG